MPWQLDTSDSRFKSLFADFLTGSRVKSIDVSEDVTSILSEVKLLGDEALCSLTKRFDGVDLIPAAIRVSDSEIDSAFAEVTEEQIKSLEMAARRIQEYHDRQLPKNDVYTDESGVELGYRWLPLESVGLYVPGGKAAYPSSVLMSGLPAKVAGVKRMVMTVPAPNGDLNPLVLAAARMVGINEVYRIGGAQAIAALAYGTSSINPVDKIVGPGNAYVTEAKRQVFGTVGIDMIAGPSEILIYSDFSTDPSWIAADLLSQAEHDESAQSILITEDANFAEAVVKAIQTHLRDLPRAKIASSSWEEHGAIILVKDQNEAVSLINQIAPEHLEIAREDADKVVGEIRNAGAIFLGAYTPEALGDYIAGPSHVLPTSKSARFSSGLSVLDFCRRTSLMRFQQDSLARLGPSAICLAEAEGLYAHALSVRIRQS